MTQVCVITYMEKDMNLKKVKESLVRYKEQKLKITDCGEWWKNHKLYNYILPIDKKYDNIIDEGFKDNLISMLPKGKLHLGFHHLNSSQALALNFFGPLVITNNLGLINSEFDLYELKAEFEYIENQNEGTNFDFFLGCSDSRNYFEVKYTEQKFGNSKNDANHRQKFLEIYKNDLESISDITEKEFYKNYQLWRNILYARKGNLYFTLPKFREDLIKKIEKAKVLIKDENLKENVRILVIDDVVTKCKEISDLRNHYEEFEKKYLNFT